MSRLIIPKQARRRVRVGMFGAIDTKRHKSTVSFSTATECRNFDMSSGALREGYGTAPHSAVPADAVRYYMYRYYSEALGCFADQYVYQKANGRLMYYEPTTGMRLYISGEPFPPMRALNYRLDSKDVLLLSFDGGKLMSWNGSVLTEYESPTVSSMALHYERLFVTSDEQPTKVFFSENLDPTNFDISADGGGFIELLDERGDLNKVVSFGGYLYIFRDHGISRVTAYGDQREFSVVNLFVTAGRIYPSSIATCGNVIMFLASDGIYAFDGYECKRVLTNLDGTIAPGDGCSCAFFDGKYYLACKLNNGGETLGGLIVYDRALGEYSVSAGLDIGFMNAATYNGEDILMCCCGGTGGVIVRNGTLGDVPLEKTWTGAYTDLGVPDRIKTVREIYIQTTAPVTLTLHCANRSKSIAVAPGERRVRVNFCASRFALSVSTTSAHCEIAPPTLVYTIGG